MTLLGGVQKNIAKGIIKGSKVQNNNGLSTVQPNPYVIENMTSQYGLNEVYNFAHHKNNNNIIAFETPKF